MAESIANTTSGISSMHFPAGIEADALSSGETVEPVIAVSGATHSIRIIPCEVAPGARDTIAGEPTGIIRQSEAGTIAGESTGIIRQSEAGSITGIPTGILHEPEVGVITGIPTGIIRQSDAGTIADESIETIPVSVAGAITGHQIKHTDGNELVYEAMHVLTDHDYLPGRILGESVLPISLVAFKNTEVLLVLVIRSRNPVPSAQSLFDQYRARVDALRTLAISPHYKIMIWVYSLQCGWRYYWVNPHAIGYDWDFAKLIGKPAH